MHTIFAKNVNDAYRSGMTLLNHYGESIESRNGPVLRVHMPVTTRYAKPMERVLFDRQRDANPFFHLFEGLWMLSGADDVSTPAQFIKSFSQFSDDGFTLHGAYGHRWRSWPHPLHIGTGIDQLDLAIEALQENLNDRRVVIGMWDPARDLCQTSKDIPCNDLIKLMVVHNALDLMVFCRSNDIVFGCYGANAVHMSMLHEYLASMIGVPVGSYYQISADYHAYTEQPYQLGTYWPLEMPDKQFVDPYAGGSPLSHGVAPYPLVTDSTTFDAELMDVMAAIQLQKFHSMEIDHFKNRFFVDVAQPMYLAHQYYKFGGLTTVSRAAHLLDVKKRMPDGTTNDWLASGEQWIRTRIDRRAKKDT
jgi:thymidylate synthase